ncbi:MAG: Ig-like domain-containing protein [Gemmatimonadales bacterium]
MSALESLRRPLAVALTSLIAGLACTQSTETPENQPPAVAAVGLAPPLATIDAGTTVQFTATPRAEDGTPLDRSVTWRSSDAAVATVSAAGLAAGLRAGATQVTATSEGVSSMAVLTVLEPVAAVTVNPAVVTLRPGETVILGATPLDARGDALVRPLTWRAADPTVASVDGRGVVTAVAPGQTAITAAIGAISGSSLVTVRPPVGSVVVSPASATVVLGADLALGATVLDPGGKALTLPVSWSSDAPVVATVSAAGVVTPHSVGLAAIRASTEGVVGLGVIQVIPAVDRVVVAPVTATIEIAQTLDLAVEVFDADNQPLANRMIEWTSANPAVATVAGSGLVTGVGAGDATISARSENRTGTAAITVRAAVAEVEVPAAASLEVGEAMSIPAVPTDEHGTPLAREVTWTTSDPTIATVDGHGVVTAIRAGTATIGARAGNHTSWTVVTVMPAVARVTITPATGILVVASTLQFTADVRDALGTALRRDVTWSSSDPAVATIDAAGLARAAAPGNVVFTVTAGRTSGTANFSVRVAVGSVSVSPERDTVIAGQSVTLAARAFDRIGNRLQTPVSWTSRQPAIATVQGGRVTGVTAGTAEILASSYEGIGSAVITVLPPVGTVTISDPGHEPLHVDSTRQLTATVTDALGNPLPGLTITWASADPNVATVDQTGLVLGTGRGTTRITATAGGVSGSVEIRVVGHAEEAGNNLSYPVVFAEGIGLTGLPVATDPGIRPTAAEGITVTALPFFFAGNLPDYGSYYLQQGANVWQAEWTDRSGTGVQEAEVAWGDNLTHQTWNTHSTIRVEVSLSAVNHPALRGFAMTTLYGSGPDEMQGTTGALLTATPAIYSVVPRLLIERLDDTNRTPVDTVFTGAVYEKFGIDGPGGFGAEVNVGGRIVYGYNLMIKNVALKAGLTKYGWYRISYLLDPVGTVGNQVISRNTSLSRLAPETETLAYPPQIDPARNVSWIDIYVTSASGGHG